MRYFFLLACLIFSDILFSQTPEPSAETKRAKHFYGFNIGLTSTDLSGSEIDLTIGYTGYIRSGAGLAVAGIYKFEPVSLFYVKTGAGLSYHYARAIGSTFIYPIDAELKFLNIPVVLGFQPLNLANTGVMNLGFEYGIEANIDAGSSSGNAAGLHPDNVVKINSAIPSMIFGVNMEFKVKEKTLVFLNYRVSKDLKDYYQRTYTVKDSGETQVYHYNYRISGTQFTFGLLFTIGKR